MQERLNFVSSVIADLAKRDETASLQLRSLAQLGEHSNWDDLDWQALVSEIAALHAERLRITSSSDTLPLLTAERERVRQEVATHEHSRDGLQRDRGAAEGRQRTAGPELDRVSALLSDAQAVEAATESFALLEVAAQLSSTDQRQTP